jgi:hypothetical protein
VQPFPPALPWNIPVLFAAKVVSLNKEEKVVIF